MHLVRGYYAEVDIDRLVPTLTVFVPIELSPHARASPGAFEAAISQRPEVLECYAMGSGFDYMLKVITPDIATYQALVDELLGSGLGIVRYDTYIVIRAVKQRQGYPLRQLLGGREGVMLPPAAPGLPRLRARQGLR
jgi:Lrp/AsnC family transcriptional regulator of ectoine degradation